MFVFILSTLFLLTSAVTYKSVGSGFCANSNSQQLSYVAIVDVPDAETCERNCSSTSSCNGYLILVTLQCFLYGDPSALSSSDVCKTQTCSEITNDGGSAVATGVVGGPQVNCFVKETSSITYSEVGGGFCSNINQQPIPYVVIVDVSDDVACGQYCSCTEHCRGYLRLGSGPCWLYGDPFWLESDVPCLTAGVECHPIVEDNEGAPGDILNLAPTTCFAKDALQLYASYSTIGDGFCVDSSHEIIERVGFTATSDWNCLMNCTATSICEGYNYLDSVCYLFGPTELVDSEICERTACTHLTGSSNSISLAIGPPTTTCFSKSTHYIDYQESTGLCMDSNSQILPHVTATISSGFNPAQVPIATSSYCGSLCSSSALCTHYSIVAADISVNPDAVDTCILYGSTSELLSSVSCYDQDITCSSTQETDSSSGNCFTKLTYSSIGPGFCVDSNAGTIASMAFSTTSEQICQQYCSETINCIGFSYLASTDLCYLNGFLDSIEAEAVCTTRAGTTESCSRVPGTYKNISGAVGPPTTSCWQKDGSTIITPSPTLFPTALPTHVPTSAPTSPPTTSSPSQVPSFQPTTIPTVTPTKAPTDRPTSVPTQQPITSRPTTTPSVDPTRIPTQIPSSVPTYIPTTIPTFIPSYIPTFVPTQIPSVSAAAPKKSEAFYEEFEWDDFDWDYQYGSIIILGTSFCCLLICIFACCKPDKNVSRTSTIREKYDEKDVVFRQTEKSIESEEYNSDDESYTASESIPPLPRQVTYGSVQFSNIEPGTEEYEYIQNAMSNDQNGEEDFMIIGEHEEEEYGKIYDEEEYGKIYEDLGISISTKRFIAGKMQKKMLLND